MKFEQAARHLEEVGFVVLVPNGRSRPTKKRLPRRNPVRVVPVRVLKKGTLPDDLREMIRQSRAEIRHSTERAHVRSVR